MKLDNLLIDSQQTVIDAISKLNKLQDISGLTLFVTDKDSRVIGSVTDGDIRRGLLRYGDINRPITDVCNKNFSYELARQGYVDFSPHLARDLKVIPVLDECLKLVDIIDLDKQCAKLPLECMIMAGGRGKRLSPLTDTVPKPMLELGGMPIIERNIERLVQFGIKKFYISVKYLGEQIVEHFGDGSSHGIEIEYVWEDEPLGTAGALSLVKQFGTKHVLLMNSDLLTNVNLESMYKLLLREKADMVVASTEYKVDIPYAIFETSGNQVTDFKEKPCKIYHASAGIYILKRELIMQIPKNTFFDITQLMENLVKSGGKLVYCPIVGYWIDIGKPADYKQAQDFVSYLR